MVKITNPPPVALPIQDIAIRATPMVEAIPFVDVEVAGTAILAEELAALGVSSEGERRGGHRRSFSRPSDDCLA